MTKYAWITFAPPLRYKYISSRKYTTVERAARAMNSLIAIPHSVAVPKSRTYLVALEKPRKARALTTEEAERFEATRKTLKEAYTARETTVKGKKRISFNPNAYEHTLLTQEAFAEFIEQCPLWA